MKLEAVSSLKKVKYILMTNRPTGDKESEKSDSDNDDVVSIIKLTLSNDQAIQFTDGSNARDLWAKIKETYVCALKILKSTPQLLLRSISMDDKETGADYVAHARGLASKCKGLGVNISDRELVYYVVRDLNGKLRIRNTLKTQRDKKLDDMLEALREKENELFNQKKCNDAAYAARDGKRNAGKKYYVCKKPGHQAKTRWHRRSNDNNGKKKDRQQDRGNQCSDAQQQGRPQQNLQDGRNDRSEKANEATNDYTFKAYNEDCEDKRNM